MPKSALHLIAEHDRGGGEPDSGGLRRLDVEERVARRARLPNKGIFYAVEREGYFNKKLQEGQWVAYGFSINQGKRVRIQSPWDPELKLNAVGDKLSGRGDRFNDVRFYRVAGHAEVDANESEKAPPEPLPTPRIGRPSKAPEIKAAFLKLETENAIDFEEPMARVYPLVRLEITKKEEVSEGLGDEAIRLIISPLFNARKVARKVTNKL